jgi:hypothetical protein
VGRSNVGRAMRAIFICAAAAGRRPAEWAVEPVIDGRPVRGYVGTGGWLFVHSILRVPRPYS